MKPIHSQILTIGMLILLMIVAMITGWTWVVVFCAVLIILAGSNVVEKRNDPKDQA
jgi:hypothetical protein